MLVRILGRLVLTAALLAVPLAASAATYEIDNTHTSVLFKLSHLGVAPFYGRFNKVEGTFVIDGDKSALDLTVDANSVFTADKKRDDHLKSPDFFNTKQFPTITLKSTRVQAGKAAGSYVVTADLTLRGVTKSITFTATKSGEGKDPMGNERLGFEASFTINRLDFGVSFGPGALGNDVTIIVAVQGIKKG